LLLRRPFRTVYVVSSRTTGRLLAFFVLVSVVFVSRTGSAMEEIRIGTLAPRDSVWGRTLGAWAASVHQESGGQLRISLYFGGSQGDEPALVAKVRDRSLDGAALGGSGLSAFVPDVIALELPGIYSSFSRLDRGRNAVRAKLAEGFDRAGVRLLAEGDVGVLRLFSRENEVKSPRDLARMLTFVRSDDLVGKAFIDTLALPNRPPVLSVPQILGALLPPRAPVDGGVAPHVNVVFASSLAVTELKWADMLDYVTPQPTVYGIGGIVIHSGRFDSLPPEARAILKRTADATGSLLSQRVRAADDQAYQKLRAEKRVVELGEDARTEWVEACKKLKALVRSRAQHPEIVDLAVAAGQ
jgi:TRAP-type transport system periplasmic protein